MIKTEPVDIPEKTKDELTEAKKKTQVLNKLGKKHLEIVNKKYNNLQKKLDI